MLSRQEGLTKTGASTKEKCGEPNRLLIRSASNAYFPQIQSVISIPDPAAALLQAVHSPWDFLSEAESPADIKDERKKAKVGPLLAPYADEEVFEVVKQVKSGTPAETRAVKLVELDALTKATDDLGSDVPEGDFFAQRLTVPSGSSPEMTRLDRVVLVQRLREVAAQVGFTRFEAAGTSYSEGTLGCLVQAGRNIPRHLRAALEAVAGALDSRPPASALFDLVLSGPELPGTPTADPAAVLLLRGG